MKIHIKMPHLNMQEAEKRLEDAAKHNIDLLVLPEMALTGYIFDTDELKAFSEPADGPSVRFWQSLAARYHMSLVVGFAERDGKKFFSSSVLIDKNGQIVGLYRKINEKPPLDKGDRVHVFKLGSINLSMLICGDLFDGRVISMLKTSNRINLLAVPMCRCFDGKTPDIDRWENEERRVYVEAVRELADYILISNALEVSANESFGGGLIISRANSVLAETKHGTDEIVWIDVAL